MSSSLRKSLLLLTMIVLIVAESVYFGRRVYAGYEQIVGRIAFINSDFGRAWEAYETAIRAGGDRLSLEAEILDLLVFTLLQSEGGIDLGLPVSRDESLPLAWNLAGRQLKHFPYEAHAWKRVADLKFHEAHLIRSQTPIDLSQVSDNALDNILEEEEAAVDSLGMAGSLEPNNYFFHDLLASFFMQVGAIEEAAQQVRKAVSCYPRLDDHVYLADRKVPDEIVKAAVAGFLDATERESLVRDAYMLVDAGRLLMRQGDNQQAVVLLEQAVAQAPDLFDAQNRLGQALYRLGYYQRAVERFRQATELSPSSASAYYYLGESYAALGDLPKAIEALTSARQKQPERLKYRHALGEALERAGRVLEAERQFVAAANMRSDDPVTWLELTRFYSRTDAHAAAQEACARLLSLDAANPGYQKLCSTLRQGSR